MSEERADIIDRLNDSEIYVDAIDDAIQEIETLREIAKYAQHGPGCMSRMKAERVGGKFSRYACDCGLDKLLQTL